MISKDQKEQVVDRVGFFCVCAEQLYGGEFTPDAVLFDIRRNSMRSGQYCYTVHRNGCMSHVLRFNQAFLARYWDDMMENTVPHEVAHFVAKVREGREPDFIEDGHGPNWEGIMKDFWVRPLIHHRYSIEHTRPYVYRCSCREVPLTSIRHNRSQRKGGAYYRCKRCGNSLIYMRKVT